MSKLNDILNWRVFDDSVTTSGQMTAIQVEELATAGVEIILNLGPNEHKDTLHAESKIVEVLGMHYVHIPVSFTAPNQSDFDRFKNVFARLKK